MECTLLRTCRICGAIISDNNPDGIGSQCRAVYSKATYKVYLEDQQRRNKYYQIGIKDLMDYLKDYAEGKKFRSAFKKSFIPSVISWYDEKGFISKKQKEIIENMLRWDDGFSDWDQEQAKLNREEKAALIREWKPTSEEMDKIINLANSFRHNLTGAVNGNV